MRVSEKEIYERFHKSSNLQKRIINQKNFTYRHLISIANSYLSGKGSVLDVGCGVGTIDFYLASKGHRVVGIDISRKAIECARLNAKELNVENNINFKVINFPKEVPKGKYNFIICSEVLEHICEDKKALLELFKLLKSGGLMLITVPSQNAPLYKVGLLNRFEKRVGHRRRYEISELVEQLKLLDLIIMETKESEGVLRNFLFTFSVGGVLVKLANKFNIISDLVTLTDHVIGRIMGYSNIYIVAQKK